MKISTENTIMDTIRILFQVDSEGVNALLNIAICDDMAALREILDAVINEYAAKNNMLCSIKQFESGEALVEEYKRCGGGFHLIFLDNKMKQLTGAETALIIRKYDRQCGIVFVTSCDSRYEFTASAPLKILQKPIGKEEIFKVLDMFLAGSRQQCG